MFMTALKVQIIGVMLSLYYRHITAQVLSVTIPLTAYNGWCARVLSKPSCGVCYRRFRPGAIS